MKYAMVVWEDGGFSIDPRPYIDELPRLQAELPPGAWAFASDPGHYDMGHGNQRCVKNLQLAGVRVATDKSGGLVLEFAPNPWKHDAGLRLSYDACGRVSAETDFNGRTTTYSHNAAGHLVTRTNGAGETVQFERDSLGRVTKQSSGSDIATTFEYGRDGNLGRAVNAHAEIVLERDSVGRTVAESTNGMRVTHAHDVLGQRTRRTTASGWSSHWTYDPAGRPVELRSVAGPSTFEFDAAGREVERRIGDSVTLRQEWAPEGLLITQALSVNADEVGRGRLVQHRAYRHRADGVITEVRELTAGTRRYDLDSTGRVKSVRAHGWGEQYAYDASGALVHAAAPGGGGSEAREFDGTLIRRAGCTRYEHDAQGRLVRKTRKLLNGRRRVWTYSWDAEDRLIEVTTPNAERWQYAYDPLGRRISKQRVSGAAEESTRTEFVWSGVHLVEQIEPDGQITTWDYAPDDPHRPVSQTSHRARAASANDSFLAQLADDTVDEVIPVQQALITDVLGTPTELITACGEIVWQRRTTLWGNTLSDPDDSSGDGCPLRFPGQYADSETGLHYNHFRYYDPETARYLSPDPLGLDPAPDHHGYVLNPLGWRDPLGLSGKGPSGPKNPLNFGHGYTGRRDTWPVGNKGRDVEIHVYDKSMREVGVFNSQGWFNKHGIKGSDVEVPPAVENAIKGRMIEELRNVHRIGEKGTEDITGDKWRRPPLAAEGCK